MESSQICGSVWVPRQARTCKRKVRIGYNGDGVSEVQPWRRQHWWVVSAVVAPHATYVVQNARLLHHSGVSVLRSLPFNPGRCSFLQDACIHTRGGVCSPVLGSPVVGFPVLGSQISSRVPPLREVVYDTVLLMYNGVLMMHARTQQA